MKTPTYLFRLRVEGQPQSVTRFRSARGTFRTALADAMIQLRVASQTARLHLEIARETPSRVDWLVKQPDGASEPLPEFLRWESVVDYYDQLVRVRSAADQADAARVTRATAEHSSRR